MLYISSYIIDIVHCVNTWGHLCCNINIFFFSMFSTLEHSHYPDSSIQSLCSYRIQDNSDIDSPIHTFILGTINVATTTLYFSMFSTLKPSHCPYNTIQSVCPIYRTKDTSAIVSSAYILIFGTNSKTI